jgi:hypothetical protein
MRSGRRVNRAACALMSISRQLGRGGLVPFGGGGGAVLAQCRWILRPETMGLSKLLRALHVGSGSLCCACLEADRWGLRVQRRLRAFIPDIRGLGTSTPKQLFVALCSKILNGMQPFAASCINFDYAHGSVARFFLRCFSHYYIGCVDVAVLTDQPDNRMIYCTRKPREDAA